ncbi:hypothetical protein JOM56_012109 [Amanita muscaria]
MLPESSHLVSREENPDRMPGVERMGLSARWSDAVNFEDTLMFMHHELTAWQSTIVCWDLDRLLPLLAIVDTPVVVTGGKEIKLRLIKTRGRLSPLIGCGNVLLCEENAKYETSSKNPPRFITPSAIAQSMTGILLQLVVTLSVVATSAAQNSSSNVNDDPAQPLFPESFTDSAFAKAKASMRAFLTVEQYSSAPPGIALEAGILEG